MLERIPLAVEGQLIRRRCHKLINHLARELERQKRFELAAKWYQQSSRPPAAERRIRCLEKMGQFQQAWQELQSMKRGLLPQQEQVFIRTFEKKLANKLKNKREQESYSEALNLPAEEVVPLVKTSPTVELDVVNHLAETEQGDAWWCENRLWNMLFALSYWDLIFADVDGAFYNPFQVVPADIYEPEFLLRRAQHYQVLQNCIKDDQQFKQLLLHNYKCHHGKACLFADWSKVDEALLFRALERIPLDHIRVCIHRILHDPKEHRSGLPDLIFFPKDQGYQLIEVKGPGDRLQNNQKMWMDFFAKHSIPHRIIRVVYSDESMLTSAPKKTQNREGR
jgi:hypothetical protein